MISQLEDTKDTDYEDLVRKEVKLLPLDGLKMELEIAGMRQ